MAQPASNSARGRVDYTKRYAPQGVSRSTGRKFGGIEPGTLTGILSEAQTGRSEDWVDLCSYMVRTDAHVRSVVITRTQSVAGAKLVVEPGRARPGEEALAEKAADDVREEFEDLADREDRFADLLYGTMTGVAVLENKWRPEVDRVRMGFGFVHPRDVRFCGDWTVELRTYVDGKEQWVRVSDHPGKFVVNAPHSYAERATLTGELMAIAWPWLFKRWIEKFGLDGFQRLANGFLYGVVDGAAAGETVESLREGLEALAADGNAVFKVAQGAADPVKLLESSKDPGASAIALVQYYNGEISKALLGSGLNVEVSGPNGSGNRALGESQFDTTTLPRLIADAARVCGALTRDAVIPFLQYNTHRYGGRMPPVPRVRLELVNEEPPNVDQIAVDSGAITVDELRQSRGLEPLGPERRGDRFVQPLAKAPFQSGGDPKAEDVQSTALNGAQVASALEIVSKVARGEIPRASGIQLLVLAFQLDESTAEQLMGTAGTSQFVPAAPESGGSFSDAPVVTPGGAAPLPFSARSTKASGSATATPTSTRSRTTPLGRALSGRSGDPER